MIGSSALSLQIPEWREPKDIDYFVDTDQDLKELGNLDTHKVPTGIIRLFKGLVATPDEVYTLKLSHLVYDIHWWKNAQDVLSLKMNHGCKIVPELYEELIKFWKTEHGNKDFLNLNRTKSEFFDDFVEKKYDHDYLHEVVSFPDVPMYTKCLKDGNEVLTDWNKFGKLTKQEQIKMFKEEICVIATERWLLNDNFKVEPIQAYLFSLRKTVTALTKGKSSRFIVENLEEFLEPLPYWLSNLNDKGIYKMTTTPEWVNDFKELSVGFKWEENKATGKWHRNSEKPVYDRHDLANTLTERLYTPTVRDVEDIESEAQQYLRENGYEHIEQDGGGEGGSEYCYSVFKLHSKLWKMTYSYYSYDGFNFDGALEGIHEVKPVVKEVTFYE